MKKNSRIRFNPVTKEIEVEGSESFVKNYFDKLQAMISGTAEKKTRGSKPIKAAVKANKKKLKAVKAHRRKKAMKVSGKKRITNIASVLGLIQESTEGISTSELKGKSGLSERQIWSIVNRAAKAGKIRKVKRGVYGRVAVS